ATTEIYTLSLHDALPISEDRVVKVKTPSDPVERIVPFDRLQHGVVDRTDEVDKLAVDDTHYAHSAAEREDGNGLASNDQRHAASEPGGSAVFGAGTPEPGQQPLSGDVPGIVTVHRVAAHMPLLRLGAEEIDQVHPAQQHAGLHGLHPAGAGDERHRDQPPAQILADIGGMLAPAVRTVGDDAAMREIGKAQPEGR